MNNELFQQAKTASLARDYERALALYAQCLEDPVNPPEPGEIGLIHHQMGNCLTKLGSYYEAIQEYSAAASDTDYDACGAVNNNIGMAYAAVRDWGNAVKHFEIAVSDRSYPTKYKAYQGMGNALLKQGKSAEAGVAFREAALDEANPDPTKALLNLGVCFMALGRPAYAVASYESALQFPMSSDMRNKMYASLGQAYVACGQMQKAADAFEQAIADKTYFLSASASVDYQRAIAAVAQGTAELTQSMPMVGIDTSGLDVVHADEDAHDAEEDAFPGAAEPVDETYYFADAYAEDGDFTNNEERFFSASDEELEEWSRGVVRMERKRRSVGLKVFVGFLIVLILLVGAAGFLYWQGYGWPMQDAVIEQVFNNPKDSSLYASDVSVDKINQYAALLPENARSVKVDGMNKSTFATTAYVTATTAQGGDVTYEIQLARDTIGWKISHVELYFASKG